MKKVLIAIPLLIVIGWFAYTTIATKTLEYMSGEGARLLTAQYPAKYSFDQGTGILSASSVVCEGNQFFSKITVADKFSDYEYYATNPDMYQRFAPVEPLFYSEGLGGTIYYIFTAKNSSRRYSAVRFVDDIMVEILYPPEDSCVRQKFNVDKEIRLMIHTIRYDDALVDYRD